MTTVGLYDKDARIYYVDPDYAVIGDPTDHEVPTLIKRTKGPLNDESVARVLRVVGMSVKGQPYQRKDGLWCVKLNAREGENVNSTYNDWRRRSQG